MTKLTFVIIYGITVVEPFVLVVETMLVVETVFEVLCVLKRVLGGGLGVACT